MTHHLFHRPLRTAAALTASGALLLGGSAVAAAGPLDIVTGSLATASSALGSTQPDDTATVGRFASVDNFRDVAGDAGDGYALPGGGHMKQGVFYRSNQLVGVSDEDLNALEDLGLTEIYDLRIDSDINAPYIGGEDVDVDGATYNQIPIDTGNFMQDAAGFNSPDDATAYMQEMYRDFVTDSDSRAKFGELLTAMADNDGPQVFHCTSGKDRTGWTAMLLQHIAGADDATILEDYLATNDYSAGSIQKTLGMIGNIPKYSAENLKPLLVVDESYLQAGLDAVDEDYGSIDNYLTAGLGLSQDTIDTLKATLVA